MATNIDEKFQPVTCNKAYEVSNLGRVRRVGSKECLTSTPCTARKYLGLTLYSDGQAQRVYTHRLVAQAFLGAKDSDIVHHINNCPQDARLENLAIVTASENARRSHIDATAHVMQGERAPHLWGKGGHLTSCQVLALRRARQSGRAGAVSAMAREYGVSLSVAGGAARGTTYTWVMSSLETEVLRQEEESARAARKAVAAVKRSRAARAALKGSK